MTVNDDEVRDAGMPITHNNLEFILKAVFEKLRIHLCAKFGPEDYNVVLSDGLASDLVVQNGPVVIIKVKTQRLVEAMTKRGFGNDFRQLLESGLRMVPRMGISLTRKPVADVLFFNPETKRFKRMTQEDYNALNPTHPYDKEIHYRTEYRVSAIHWKAGVVVREIGTNAEAATHRARRRILSILTDPGIYHRVDSNFISVESHEDVIHDLVLSAKVLDKSEIETLIHNLQKEYLK